MSNLLHTDSTYSQWINELSQRFRQRQIKAAVHVNEEMLRFYWELGRDIVTRDAENRYGSVFFKNLSQDLQNVLPGVKGFSINNLYYIRKFYQIYGNKFPQVGENLSSTKFPQLEGILFSIPWGHHKVLIDKFADNPEAAVFYIRKTIEYGWSRSMLLNMVDTNLHLRDGKAITNFKNTLPAVNSDLAPTTFQN